MPDNTTTQQDRIIGDAENQVKVPIAELSAIIDELDRRLTEANKTIDGLELEREERDQTIRALQKQLDERAT